MPKLTISERVQLKEVCKETLIRKFTQKEAHIYVNSKLQDFNISFDYAKGKKPDIKEHQRRIITIRKRPVCFNPIVVFR